MNPLFLEGDVREVLRGLRARSVQCCVTSPPYWGLRDYGIPPSIWGGDPNCSHEWGAEISVNATNHTDKRRWNHTRNGRNELQPTHKRVAWLRTEVKQRAFCKCGAWRGVLGLEPTPQLYVSHLVEIFHEVQRVLRDDGTLWLNLGDCYATGGGKFNSPGGGKQGQYWKGYRGNHNGDTKRPNWTGPHLQPNRMPIAGLKPKDLVGIPWRVAFALQADGWYLRSDIIWHKPNPMPESVTDRPTKAHEYLFLLAKSERYYYDAEAIKEPCQPDTPHRYLRGRGDDHKWADGGPGGQTIATNKPGSLFAVTGRKSGNKIRKTNDGTRSRTNNHLGSSVPWEDTGKGRNKRSVWTLSTKPYKGAHFATFPPKLIEPCILAGSRPGDVVLDCFAGSGTAPVLAYQLGRRGVGIELKPEYIDLAYQRAGMAIEAA